MTIEPGFHLPKSILLKSIDNYFLLVLLLTICAIFLFSRFVSFKSRKISKCFTFCDIFSAVLARTIPEKSIPKSWPLKFILSSLFFVGLIMFNMFGGVLVSLMTVLESAPRIHSLADLAKLSEEGCVTVATSDALSEMFKV